MRLANQDWDLSLMKGINYILGINLDFCPYRERKINYLNENNLKNVLPIDISNVCRLNVCISFPI